MQKVNWAPGRSLILLRTPGSRAWRVWILLLALPSLLRAHHFQISNPQSHCPSFWISCLYLQDLKRPYKTCTCRMRPKSRTFASATGFAWGLGQLTRQVCLKFLLCTNPSSIRCHLGM